MAAANSPALQRTPAPPLKAILGYAEVALGDPILNDSGMTELLLAVYYGDPEWVAACIAGGLDLTARSNNGYTALHWAVDMGCVGRREDRIAVVRALVEAGADVTALNAGGETPAVTARHSTSEYLIPYLKKRRKRSPGK